jgi:hypothetical protein
LSLQKRLRRQAFDSIAYVLDGWGVSIRVRPQTAHIVPDPNAPRPEVVVGTTAHNILVDA